MLKKYELNVMTVPYDPRQQLFGQTEALLLFPRTGRSEKSCGTVLLRLHAPSLGRFWRVSPGPRTNESREDGVEIPWK